MAGQFYPKPPSPQEPQRGGEGSECEWGPLPLLTLAAEQVTQSSNLAHHEELSTGT